MKKILLITLILLSTYTVFSQNTYPPLKEREDIKISLDDQLANSKKEFYQEYYNLYLTAISKNSHAQIGKSNTSSLPWNLILKHNPKTFFESVVNSITFCRKRNNQYEFRIMYLMSKEDIMEQKTTGGIVVKDGLPDLFKIKIISTNLTNTKDNKKITLDDHLIKSSGSWFPDNNPVYRRYNYFNYLDNINDIEGNVNIQISLPTEYEVTEVNQQQVGQTIEVNKELKIKILAFEDNTLHFEILDNKTLNMNILFSEDTGGHHRYTINRYRYDFYRMNPELDYEQFAQKLDKHLDSILDEKVEKNNILMYKFQNKIEKFYLYRSINKTELIKNMTLTLEHNYD